MGSSGDGPRLAVELVAGGQLEVVDETSGFDILNLASGRVYDLLEILRGVVCQSIEEGGLFADTINAGGEFTDLAVDLDEFIVESSFGFFQSHLLVRGHANWCMHHEVEDLLSLPELMNDLEGTCHLKLVPEDLEEGGEANGVISGWLG